jgi:hypothetical protein
MPAAPSLPPQLSFLAHEEHYPRHQSSLAACVWRVALALKACVLPFSRPRWRHFWKAD